MQECDFKLRILRLRMALADIEPGCRGGMASRMAVAELLGVHLETVKGWELFNRVPNRQSILKRLLEVETEVKAKRSTLNLQ